VRDDLHFSLGHQANRQWSECGGGAVVLHESEALSGLLELCELPDDILVGLEVQIPYYSERIDAVLYGYDAANRPTVS
jgi:hypothetical protein